MVKKLNYLSLFLLGAVFVIELTKETYAEPKGEIAYIPEPVSVTQLDGVDKPKYQLWLYHTAKNYQTKEEVVQAVKKSKVKVWAPHTKEKIWPGHYLIVGPHGSIHTWAVKATVKNGYITRILNP